LREKIILWSWKIPGGQNYSVEIFLKAGVVLSYYGCSSAMLNQRTRYFGHDYKKLAEEIGFPKEGSDDGNLALLSEFVTDIARYPVILGPDKESNSEKLQKNNDSFYNKEKFHELCNLAERCKEYVSIGSTKNIENIENIIYIAPPIYCPIDDGYISIIQCKNIKPRIIFRRSSKMRKNGGGNKEDWLKLVKERAEKYTHDIELLWEKADWLEDKKIEKKRVKFDLTLDQYAKLKACTEKQGKTTEELLTNFVEQLEE